jgi:hypothetical protein
MSEDGSASEFPFTSYLNLEKKKEKIFGLVVVKNYNFSFFFLELNLHR